MKMTFRFSQFVSLPLTVVILLCASCVSVEPYIGPDSARLLTHSKFGVRAGTPSLLNPAEILKMDDEMKLWVQDKIAGAPSHEYRLRRLVSGLLEDGLLNLEYDENETYTARETFHRRRGNCLSFSILFVALAREAGLDARFQLVDVPPSFSADEELMLLNEHINVVIRRIRSDFRFVRDHVVDFNTAEYSGNYDLRRVSDEYAFALFYSNLGVELMRGDEYAQSFSALKQSIELDDSIPGPWVNLGVLYSRTGEFDFALGAHHQALKVKPWNNSALVNLASLNARLGNEVEAERYRALIGRYLKRNPYYFFEKAKTAYGAEKYEDAIAFLKRSIRLRRDEHQFYYLRAISHLALDEVDAARKNLVLAERNSSREVLAKKYQHKLGLLDNHIN